MNSKILPKVFGWMFLGLLLTFATGFFISLHPYAMLKMISGAGLIGILIAEVVLVIFLSWRIQKMSPITAKICFMLYSIVTGITFSTIFIAYDMTSIISVFLITAVIFGVFALIGSKTKADLSKVGTYLFMALIGVIICTIVNIFLNNSTFDLMISCLTVVVFVGLTAYDVQKIIRLESFSMIPEENLAIYGALQLYLDFINLFLELLKLFGNDRD